MRVKNCKQGKGCLHARVDIIESERGWGQKIDETICFTTAKEADAFVTKYNKQNTGTTVPDWYMVAQRTR